MNRRDFLKTAAFSIGGLSGLGAANLFAADDKHKKYNVILILVDDQGYGDLSCHGNPALKTPHLDRLHDQSVRFTDFHVNPFCAPSRASLLTGKLSDRVNVRRTLNMRNYLPKEEKTLADLFRNNGYKTGLFGKWHLGHNYPYRPIDRGFDEWFGIGDCGLAATSDYWGNDRFDDHYVHNGRWQFDDGFNTDVIVDRAIHFIRDNRGRPFFMYLAPNVPHFPWNVKTEWARRHKDKDLPDELDIFYASIERVDQNIGRLMKCVTDLELGKDTIVIYLTDNGTAHFNNIYNAGMRAHKGSVYEGGHRVPCFIKGPDEIFGRPRDIETLTAHFDLMPTLAEICSLKLSKDTAFDGRSLMPLLKSSDASWPDRAWVLHSQNMNEIPIKWKDCVVLTERWRLINGKALYDINADPGQKNDVAAEHLDVVARLRKCYEDHWKQCNLDDPGQPERPIAGSPHQSCLELGPDAWLLKSPTDFIWWQGRVRRGDKINGYWPIMIAKDRTYRFEVRRWPAYLDSPITGVPDEQPADENVIQQKQFIFPECKALPIASVQLKVNDHIETKPVKSNECAVSFELPMNAGPADVRATFLDKDGNEITGGYYVYVK